MAEGGVTSKQIKRILLHSMDLMDSTPYFQSGQISHSHYVSLKGPFGNMQRESERSLMKLGKGLGQKNWLWPPHP